MTPFRKSYLVGKRSIKSIDGQVETLRVNTGPLHKHSVRDIRIKVIIFYNDKILLDI